MKKSDNNLKKILLSKCKSLKKEFKIKKWFFFIVNQPNNIQNKPMQWEQECIHIRGFYHQMTILIFYRTKYNIWQIVWEYSKCERREWKRVTLECMRECAKMRTRSLDSKWTISTSLRKSKYYHFSLSLSLNVPLCGDAYEQPHNFISFIKPTIKLNNAVINSN